MEFQDIKKMELKSVKVLNSMSQETYCYSARVYINGKAAVEVGNAGHGGCDEQRELIKGAISVADEYCKRTGKANLSLSRIQRENEDPVLWSNLESWCSEQVTNHLIRKDVKSQLKKFLVVYLPSENALQLYRFKQKGRVFTSMQIKSAVIGKGKDCPVNSVVLNDLEIDEAVSYWLKTENTGGADMSAYFIEFQPEFDENGNCTNIPSPPDSES